MSSRMTSVALPAVAATLVACSSHRIAPQEPSSEIPTTSATSTSVSITPRVRTSCKLPDNAADAPHFDVGSAELRPSGEETLRRVSACLTTGPLAGRTVCITGYADPRGSAHDNYELALARAYAASHYLERFGVEPARTIVMSRGEKGEPGRTELRWTMDRRVEVDLADAPDSPCQQPVP